jgi:hypothetical protein
MSKNGLHVYRPVINLGSDYKEQVAEFKEYLNFRNQTTAFSEVRFNEQPRVYLLSNRDQQKYFDFIADAIGTERHIYFAELGDYLAEELPHTVDQPMWAKAPVLHRRKGRSAQQGDTSVRSESLDADIQTPWVKEEQLAIQGLVEQYELKPEGQFKWRPVTLPNYVKIAQHRRAEDTPDRLAEVKKYIVSKDILPESLEFGPICIDDAEI